MRRIAAIALAAAVLALTACAGLPTSGTVNPGRDPLDVDDELGIAFVPDGPQPGASPDQIVEGFLRAGTGPQSGWAIAREFLTDDFANQWQPDSTVTVDRLSDRTVALRAEDDDAAAVAATVSSTAVVDDTGAYAPQSAASELPFELVREDGEWRIARAQDGIVLSEEQFRSVYRAAPLSYFDTTYTYLVPDVRWFPRINTATSVAGALLDQPPSPWLVGSVESAFPEGIYAAQSVTVSGATAEVGLTESALGLGAETLGRMQAQLDATFRAIDIGTVRMTVDGSPLTATPAPTRSTRVDSDSLVQLADGTFGFLDAEGVIAVAGLSPAIESLGAVSAIETAPQLDAAAVLTTAGTVVRATDETAVLDGRSALVPPTIDAFDTVWSVPSADPSALRAFPAGAEPVDVGAAWSEATEVHAIQVSRDGARIAALVSVRGRTELWVSGIVRGDDQLEVGERHLVTAALGAGIDLAWLDDTQIGVLERVEGDLRLRIQTVGGPGTDLTVPAGSVHLVGGNGSPRLLTEDGAVYVRQATVWQQIAEDVRVGVLAAQQGAP